jgi:hypothetical protein
VLALSVATSANAAKIELGSNRCNDGDPNCYMITIEGKIDEGDEVTFAKVAKNVTDGIVVMNSPGGHFNEQLTKLKRPSRPCCPIRFCVFGEIASPVVCGLCEVVCPLKQ